jgi:PadR family transcriptional regulator, regulatory protein PadR
LISKDLIAASSRPLILSFLARQESYGYEIIKSIQELSDNKIVWKDGTLYPVLKKLCESGLIECQWKVIDGRKRKYYRITKEGLDALESERYQWEIVNNTLNNIWRCSLCFS